jgi:hypothetical protein
VTQPVDGCFCPACEQRRAEAGAVERSEALLLEYLTPEQAKDWKRYRAFNVRGSDGGLFRIRPSRSGYHQSVVRLTPPGTAVDRYQLAYQQVIGGRAYGTAVWPIGLQLSADWALAMLLYLQSNEQQVLESGCHGWVPAKGISDYQGAL